MSSKPSDHTDARLLEIVMDSGGLPVSNFSSLLRVLQAALREVARSSDDTRAIISQQPYPVLHLSTCISQGELILAFTFADPTDSTPMSQFSERTFSLLLEQFGQFIKGLPQRGLWGESVAGTRRGRVESEVTRRLDQLRMEIRRFPKSRLRFGGKTILFEGDRMEIA